MRCSAAVDSNSRSKRQLTAEMISGSSRSMMSWTLSRNRHEERLMTIRTGVRVWWSQTRYYPSSLSLITVLTRIKGLFPPLPSLDVLLRVGLASGLDRLVAEELLGEFSVLGV